MFTTAHNYQTAGWPGPGAPPTTCSPGLVALSAWLVSEFGGQPIGCYGNRNVRGGNAKSSHAYGAATDWRYANVAAGYRNVPNIDRVIDLVIDHAQVLGVQQIHDYVEARIWKIGRGWKTQPKSSTGMGQRWAQWLHFEVHPTMWADASPIADRLGDGVVPPVLILPPVPPIGDTPMTETDVVARVAILREGNRHPDVKRVQGLIAALAGVPLVADGWMGPHTVAAVRDVQAWHRLTVDGVVGPQTWRVLLGA